MAKDDYGSWFGEGVFPDLEAEFEREVGEEVEGCWGGHFGGRRVEMDQLRLWRFFDASTQIFLSRIWLYSEETILFS